MSISLCLYPPSPENCLAIKHIHIGSIGDIALRSFGIAIHLISFVSSIFLSSLSMKTIAEHMSEKRRMCSVAMIPLTGLQPSTNDIYISIPINYTQQAQVQSSPTNNPQMAQLHVHFRPLIMVLHIKNRPAVRIHRRRIPHKLKVECPILKHGQHPRTHNHQNAHVWPAHAEVRKAAQRGETGAGVVPLPYRGAVQYTHDQTAGDGDLGLVATGCVDSEAILDHAVGRESGGVASPDGVVASGCVNRYRSEGVPEQRRGVGGRTL